MKDNEYNGYYKQAEEWPVVKDESATLEERTVQNETTKKTAASETKKAQKLRKNMLNKAVGMVAGAVAVVMVATTLKDDVRDDYICPICGKVNCEFWSPDEEVPEQVLPWEDVTTREDVIISNNPADLSIYDNYGKANGGVVPVLKDGLWGLIDYEGNVILKPTYTGFGSSPNDNGYTIFFDAEGYYIVDKEGSEVFTPSGNVVNIGIGEEDIILLIHEDISDTNEYYNKRITYYHVDGSILYDTGWYNRGEGFFDNATLFHDGVAYFSRNVEHIEIVTSTGTESESSSSESSRGIEVNGAGIVGSYETSLYKLTLDGTVTLIETDLIGYEPIATHADGYILLQRLETGSYCLFDVAAKQSSNGLVEISGSMIPDFVVETKSNAFGSWEVTTVSEWSFESIKTNGAYYNHYGPYGVVNVTYNGDKQKDILFNFWDVGLVEEESLTNCIAVYDEIVFNDYPYLAVKSGDDWFYIDYNGNILSDVYQGATSFSKEGYAMVIQNGVASIVNNRFKVLDVIEGVQAEQVGYSGDVFVIVDTDGAIRLYDYDMK